ncbi:MAG TPA: DegT/DnrJ/EryC1/StrS family aminotransferase [Candidatus Omnitrophota bacterium]|nr:DegT/DnrJ/EryC1/StrS family aminotransferase [Candidatus Omnitrophota bacterium]HPS19498.1 DegT/DnrJ/EryC1/StrS family aminotransferase [Candidatus Omnitrophota bacterium]
MQIPLLDLKAQYASIKTEIDKAVARVVESQYFILSDEVSSLEKEVSVYTGIKYAAGVASGTDALILALRAVGIGEKDLVLTTPFTFFATAEAASLLGAEPVFSDIDPETYNIDPVKAEKTIGSLPAEKRKRLKAIIPVHLYGQCADMDGIMELAKKYKLKVIEDCAQAIGATYKGRQAGTFGDISCFSFFPSKNLGGFGDGGMVLSNDEDLIKSVKKLRVHGSDKQYIHDEIAYNSRLDSLQAAVLRVKLKKLDEWLDGRRKVAEKYNAALAGLPVVTPKVAKECVHTYHQYMLATDKRDALMKHLNDNGVASRIYYPVPLHIQPCYKDLGYKNGSMPVSEKAACAVLSLPIYPELTGEQIKYITDTIKAFFGDVR